MLWSSARGKRKLHSDQQQTSRLRSLLLTKINEKTKWYRRNTANRKLQLWSPSGIKVTLRLHKTTCQGMSTNPTQQEETNSVKNLPFIWCQAGRWENFLLIRGNLPLTHSLLFVITFKTCPSAPVTSTTSKHKKDLTCLDLLCTLRKECWKSSAAN